MPLPSQPRTEGQASKPQRTTESHRGRKEGNSGEMMELYEHRIKFFLCFCPSLSMFSQQQRTADDKVKQSSVIRCSHYNNPRSCIGTAASDKTATIHMPKVFFFNLQCFFFFKDWFLTCCIAV